VPFVGWTVLALVFLDELLAVGAIGVWGFHQDPWWLWGWLLPLAAMLAWVLFASPRARFGGPLLRPLVKVLVFGLACLALWDLGLPTEAGGLLVFSIAVNAAAQLPFVTSLLATAGETAGATAGHDA